MRKPFIFVTKSLDGVLEANTIVSDSFTEAMEKFEDVATEHNPTDYLTNLIFEGMSGRVQVMCWGDPLVVRKERGVFTPFAEYISVAAIRARLVRFNEDQHPRFKKKEWMEEVMAGDVVSGYWEWVCSQLEQEADNPKLTGERMNEVNEASPANKVSDVERVVMRKRLEDLCRI